MSGWMIWVFCDIMFIREHANDKALVGDMHELVNCMLLEFDETCWSM
jgi:hypothetical protein